jgi:hypothetical protein
MNREKQDKSRSERGKTGKLRIRSLLPHFVVPVAVALILLCFFGCRS